jgi:tetratricopeptide (TPR) repeat protein
MSLKFCTLLAALFVSLYSLPGLAASNPTLEAGINAFQSGKFDDAKQKFSELLKVPSWKFAALYNLGNTAVRQKHMGEALAYYVLALKRNPHDRDTQDNIKYVYSELGGRHLTAPLTNFQLLTENILDKFTFNEALAHM